MSYRISTVADMTGIPRNTLIAWERRYGLLNPERHENGYRAYTDEDVGVLLQIKNALNAGLKISEAVDIVRRNAERANAAVELEGTVAAAWPVQCRSNSPYQSYCERLTELLVNYRGDEAKIMLAELVNVPLEIKLHEVFFPVLREMGDRWERGEASVAQEHYASGLIRTQLAALFVMTKLQPPTAPHAVCTTLPHDEHEIAALGLGVLLSQSGFRVSYLGSKMPIDDLDEFVQKQKPELLCVSCITLPQMAEFEAYVDRVSKYREQGVRVVLGGRVLADMSPKKGISVEFCEDWRSFVAN